MKTDSEEYLNHLDHSIKEKGGRGTFTIEVVNGFREAWFNFVYHTHDSRNSPVGYPDLSILDSEFHIIIELKVGNNKPSAKQVEWLRAFRQTGALTFVLWPRHRPVLRELYAGRYNNPLVQERLHVYTKHGKGEDAPHQNT